MSGIAGALGALKVVKPRASGRPDVQKSERPEQKRTPRTLTPEQRRNIVKAQKERWQKRRTDYDARESGRPAAQEPERLDVQTSEGFAKRSNPDFRKRTVYLRDTTHRQALRKWEDEGGTEFSDLVEILLKRYLA